MNEAAPLPAELAAGGGGDAPPPVPPPAAEDDAPVLQPDQPQQPSDDVQPEAEPPLPDGQPQQQQQQQQQEQQQEQEEEDAPSAAAAAAAAADDAVGEEEEEEDPLIVAQREQEAAEKAKSAPLEIPPYDEAALKEFYTDLKDAERDGEVARILGCFKLNPYEQLNLRFDAPPEDVRRQYRKLSLMVHPDKCKHPRAKDAFEVIGAAQKDLMDEEKRGKLAFLLTHAKDEVKKEWKKAAKGDAAVRLATLMNDEGKQGVEAAFEQTDEFHEHWKLKARDVLARTEWRKRKLTKRIGEEEERAKAEFKEEKEVAKKKVKDEKAWEKTREGRVGSWRDFVTQKGKKQTGPGGIKPPKLKESDADKRYIQRPVGEQFRPPPMKHAGPKPKERYADD